MTYSINYQSFKDKIDKINKLLDNSIESKDEIKINSSTSSYLDNSKSSYVIETKNDNLNNNQSSYLQDVSNVNSTTNLNYNEVTKENNLIEIGDVIGASRGLYEHYGIYIGNHKVIHFSSTESDISFNNAVIETDISRFVKDASRIFSIDFEKFNQGMKSVKFIDDFFEMLTGVDPSEYIPLEYHIFSPEETVERAKSILGKKGYDLLSNNCEHIAMWCKTGTKDCNQILNRKYRRYINSNVFINNY